MTVEPSRSGGLRRTFHEALNLALTRGRFTSVYSGLGPDTQADIDVIAFNHPDADADTIAAAYDAFQREHG
jgi:hypothetical protein